MGLGFFSISELYTFFRTWVGPVFINWSNFCRNCSDSIALASFSWLCITGYFVIWFIWLFKLRVTPHIWKHRKYTVVGVFFMFYESIEVIYNKFAFLRFHCLDIFLKTQLVRGVKKRQLGKGSEENDLVGGGGVMKWNIERWNY